MPTKKKPKLKYKYKIKLERKATGTLMATSRRHAINRAATLAVKKFGSYSTIVVTGPKGRRK